MDGRSSPPERPHLQIPTRDPSAYSYRASGWTEENGYPKVAQATPNTDTSTVSQENFSARNSAITRLMIAACLWVGHHLLFAYGATRLPVDMDTKRVRYQSDVYQLAPADYSFAVPLKWWILIGTVFAGLTAICLTGALRCANDQILCRTLKRRPQPLDRLGNSLRMFTGPLRSFTGFSPMAIMLVAWLLLLLPLAAPYCLTQELSTWRAARNITTEMPSIDFTRATIMKKRIADILQYDNADGDRTTEFDAWQKWKGALYNENIYYHYNMSAYTPYEWAQSDKCHASRTDEDCEEKARMPWMDQTSNKLHTGLYSGPSEVLQERLLSAVASGRIASLDKLRPSSTYTAKFIGPTVVCNETTDDTNPTSLWSQSFAFLRTLGRNDSALRYHAWVPDGTTFKIPPIASSSLMQPRLDYHSTDSARIWAMFASATADFELLDCQLYNASYAVQWDFKDWKMFDPVDLDIWGRPRPSKGLSYSTGSVSSVVPLNPITSFSQSLEAELTDHLDPNPISPAREIEIETQKSYMAMMEVLGSVLVGSVIPADPGPEQTIDRDPRWPTNMPTSLRRVLINPDSDFVHHMSRKHRIEQTFHQMTASLLGSDIWTVPTNQSIIIYEQLPVLVYDPVILNVSYAIPYSLVLIICIIGLRCAKLNGGTFSSNFESIILASTNIEQRLTGVKTDRRSVLKNVKVGMEDHLVANDGEWRRGPARKRKLRFVFEGEGLNGGRSDEIELTTLKTAPGERAGRVAITEV